MGWKARSGPVWHRSVGSALGLCAEICSTTKTDAGKWAGNAWTTVISASTPPAEAPITMISCLDKHPPEKTITSSIEGDCLYYRILRVFANLGVNDPHSNYQRGCVRAKLAIPSFGLIISIRLRHLLINTGHIFYSSRRRVYRRSRFGGTHLYC